MGGRFQLEIKNKNDNIILPLHSSTLTDAQQESEEMVNSYVRAVTQVFNMISPKEELYFEKVLEEKPIFSPGNISRKENKMKKEDSLDEDMIRETFMWQIKELN